MHEAVQINHTKQEIHSLNLIWIWPCVIVSDTFEIISFFVVFFPIDKH